MITLTHRFLLSHIFIFGAILCFICLLYVPYAHAESEEKKLEAITEQVEILTLVVDRLVGAHGAVLGATTVSVPVLTAQKTTLTTARATAIARLAALKKVASTTPAQKTEIATLQMTRIPNLTAQIAALVKQIAALNIVIIPKPAVVTPTRPATTTSVVKTNNDELRMTSPSIISLSTPVRSVRITWHSGSGLDSLTLVITNETTGKVVVKTTLNPAQRAFDLTSPTSGEYLVQLFGTKNKKQIVFAGSLVLRGVPAAVPTCTLTSDREEYTLGDTARFTWTTKNATLVSFIPDTSGKDNLVPPSGSLKLNGMVDIPMTVLGSPFITLSAKGNGTTAICKKTVAVEHVPSEGPIVEFVSDSTALLANSDTTASDDAGRFTIKFDVTAFEQDIYVPATVSRWPSVSGGTVYSIGGANGGAVSTGVTTGTLTSTADKTSGHYVVFEGETETFTLTVMYDPTVSGFYRLNFAGIGFKQSVSGVLINPPVPEGMSTEPLFIKHVYAL